VLRERRSRIPHPCAVPKGTRRFGGRWLGGDALLGKPTPQRVQAFVRQMMETIDEGASGRQQVVGQEFGGKRKAQASVRSVFACAE
jgi:hypothetical protein